MRSLRIVTALACLLTLAQAGPAAAEDGVPSADTHVAVTVAPEWGTVGYPLEYRIAVVNDGPDEAAGAVLRFTIPWQTRMIGHDAPRSCSGAAPVVCGLGSLPSGQSLTVTVRVRAATPGPAHFDAQINTDTADPATANNLTRTTVSISAPEYGVWRKPADSPTVGWGAAGASDPNTRHAVLFGGEINDDGDLSADTWRWNGSGWSLASVAAAPPARAMSAAAFSGAGGNTVLFGGASDTAFLNDTWTWDGTAWAPAAVSGPSSRAGHALAARDGKVVLFGGAGGTGLLNDTWEWDGSSWTKKTPAVSPPARMGHSLIEDRANGTVVLFGGCCAGESLHADTWIWDGATWKKAAPSASPPARADAAATFDPATNTATLAGGWDDDGETIGDVWSWKDRRWVRRGHGPARDGAVLLHAADDGPGKLMMAGGADPDGRLSAGIPAATFAPDWRVVSSTGPIAFGGVLAGATVTRSIVLRNLGTKDVSVPYAGVAGSAADGISADRSACSTLAPDGTCSIDVSFHAGLQTYMAAPRSATVTVWVNDSDETLSFPVTGTRQMVNLSTHALASTVSVNAAFPVSWSAPGAAGVVYDVEYSERVYRSYAWREAEWKRWRTGTTSTSGWFGGAGQPPSGQGKTMLFRVRARRGSEVSQWTPVRSTLVPIDDRNWTMKFSSGWSSVSASGRFYGTLRQTSSAGKRFSFLFETNRLMIIGDKCPSCGAFDVYVDRVKVARVDSYAKGTLARQVLFDKYFSNGIKRHQLEIVTAGTRGRPWVKIDGVAAAR